MAVRHILRAQKDVIGGLRDCGVATVVEAQGRIGILATDIRPVFPGARIAGSAVTVAVPPGENLMIHVALELLAEGDILVVAPDGPSMSAYVGDLVATSANARGCSGLIIDAGVRDLRDLIDMRFPVWCTEIHALGPFRSSLGSVNVPIVCGGAAIQPGDVVVADDDGVCVVAREEASIVLAKARARAADEARARERLAAGELGLDVLNLRGTLAQMGLRYI